MVTWRALIATTLIRGNVPFLQALSLTRSASRTDLSQLANGIWEIHAGCPSFLRVSSVAKIGYIPQFKASNARDQDEVSSDLARMYSTETQLLVTMHDLLQANDARVQVDIAILDFSKAFDTVPHGKLLHKLDAYGIRGSLHKWLSSFLQDRQMRMVVEGEHSESAPVESGVPQGTVLGSLMFLCHINDLPDTVKSQVRLFADDCLLYRQIKNQNDHLILQNDLNELEKWAAKWGMRFNAKKCYILSIRQKSSRFYQLDGEILQEVNSSPYLGITISNDLQWKTHITNIVKKANSTLGFLRRNLKYCPMECKRLAYIALVRSTLEYSAIVWDPYQQQDIQSLEKIQRLAARFIKNDYHSRFEGCVREMLQDLKLQPLQQRRLESRLVMLYKIVRGMVPAINADEVFIQIRNKRQIRAKNTKTIAHLTL